MNAALLLSWPGILEQRDIVLFTDSHSSNSRAAWRAWRHSQAVLYS